jgi:hypothetical protein
VKRRTKQNHTRWPSSSANPTLRELRKRLGELQQLYAEVVDIFNDLSISPSPEIARGLCARFQVLQEYFVLRYQEARTHAIRALGDIRAALYFP